MPSFKNHIAFEITRGLKFFLKLDAGVTRGEVPDQLKFIETCRGFADSWRIEKSSLLR